MALVILRPIELSNLSGEALKNFQLDALQKILQYLDDLVTLDFEVRKLRSENAETAQQFLSAVVTNAAPFGVVSVVPNVNSEVFTTLFVKSDAASGAARWRMDGSQPLAAATAAAGIQLPAGGDSITIVGWQNIKSFLIIAEAGNVNLSGHLFK